MLPNTTVALVAQAAREVRVSEDHEGLLAFEPGSSDSIAGP